MAGNKLKINKQHDMNKLNGQDTKSREKPY